MDDWIAPGAARLVSKTRLKALSVRSDVRGAAQAASAIGALAVTTAAIIVIPQGDVLLLAPVLLVHGVFLNCLYAGQHELSHRTAFRARWANDALGQLFGFLTLNPFLTDRWLHFAHHRATQDPARDPELMGMKPHTRASYLLDLLGPRFWVRRVEAIVGAAAGRGLDDAWWLGARERRIVILEARCHVALWAAIATASLAFASWSAVLFWLGPLLATKAFHQLQNTGEHTAMPRTPDVFASTRTLEGPWPMRWLMWNMSYHTAHHAYPGTPFHALPALHAEIGRNRPHPIPTMGYIAAQIAILNSLPRRRTRGAELVEAGRGGKGGT